MPTPWSSGPLRRDPKRSVRDVGVVLAVVAGDPRHRVMDGPSAAKVLGTRFRLGSDWEEARLGIGFPLLPLLGGLAASLSGTQGSQFEHYQLAAEWDGLQWADEGEDRSPSQLK